MKLLKYIMLFWFLEYSYFQICTIHTFHRMIISGPVIIEHASYLVGILSFWNCCWFPHVFPQLLHSLSILCLLSLLVLVGILDWLIILFALSCVSYPFQKRFETVTKEKYREVFRQLVDSPDVGIRMNPGASIRSPTWTARAQTLVPSSVVHSRP